MHYSYNVINLLFKLQSRSKLVSKEPFLFGKWIGTFVNIILSGYVFFMLLLVLWSSTGFAITMYLIKTPSYFIAGIFVLVAAYATTKGIETIGRTSEILAYLTIIILIINIISLGTQINLDFFKPVLINGITPPIRHSLHFTSYLFTPLIMIAVIPKILNKNKKIFNRWIYVGHFIIFNITLITGVVVRNRFLSISAYYVQRK